MDKQNQVLPIPPKKINIIGTGVSAVTMQQAVDYAHRNNVKVYVTVNILAHQEDLKGLKKYMRFLEEAAVDGIIISDPGILAMAKEIIPDVFISFQV